MKKFKITKKWLKEQGITRVTKSGDIYIGNNVLMHHTQTQHHKWGDKQYEVVCIYDRDLYNEQKERVKMGLRTVALGERYLLVHRVMWAWFKGETPSSEYDVCHKDDDGLNNKWNNLTVMLHIDNLHSRKMAGNQYKRWEESVKYEKK